MNFEKLISTSGLPIYYLQMPHAKSVATGVLVRIGTRDEIWPQEAGIAHAIEHMLFRGTEDFPDSQKLAAYIEDTGGGLNAWTSSEMTLFYNVLPANKVRRGVHSLSQMLRKSLFRNKDVKVEMQSVIQEIKRMHDIPQDYLGTKSNEIIYNGHPLGRSPLGTEEAVSNFTPKSFRSFIQKFYHPANYALLVIGNFQTEQIEDLFEEYFPENSNTLPNKRRKITTTPPKDKLFTMTRQIEQCHLVIETLTCGVNSSDRLPLTVFQAMISGGMSSPLFQEVRDKRGLAYELEAGCGFYSDAGDFYIYIGTDPKRKDEAIEATLGVIKNSVRTDLLKKAQEIMTGKLALRYEKPSSILQIAAGEVGKTEKIKPFEKKAREIKTVTLDQVKKARDKYLSEEKLVTVMLLPEESES